MGSCIVYVTFDTREAAEVLVAQLLKERLVAGVNYFPVLSQFWWNDQIENRGEWAAVLHTRSELWSELQTRIKQLHSYRIPCILKWDVDGAASFRQWTINETSGDRDKPA